MVKKVLNTIGIILAIFTITLLGYVGYLTIKDYRPEDEIILEIDSKSSEAIKIG